MCEDSDEEISELDIQSRTWSKMENNMKSAGYREGVANGKDLTLQEGFDLGYTDGFKLGKLLGIAKGISCYELELGLSSSTNVNFNEKNFISEACVLCLNEKISKKPPKEEISFDNFEVLRSAQEKLTDELINKYELKTNFNKS